MLYDNSFSSQYYNLWRYINFWYFCSMCIDNFTKFIQVLMVVVPPEKDEADAEENCSVNNDQRETEAPMIAAVV